MLQFLFRIMQMSHYYNLKPLILFISIYGIHNVQADSLTATCIKTEREALLKLKQAFTDPSNRLSTWLLGEEDCCSWVGVGCDNKTGHVIKLDLRNPISLVDHGFDEVIEASLGGEVSDSLLELSLIEHLDLSNNDFSGLEIPGFLGYLRNLKYLNLAASGFTGKIPHSFGNFTTIRYLDLGWSYGLIIDSLNWLTKFRSLEYLDLSGIDLEKVNDWLLSINMVPSLKELHLSSCQLSSFPSLSPVNLTSLAVLELDGNSFSSAISSWLFNLSEIQHLDLNMNAFRGSLSNEIGRFDSLVFLDLSNNILEGGLPKTLGNLCELEVINLRLNQFSGGISDPFGNSSGCVHHSLKTLDVGLNFFMSGSLPNFLGRFSKLENLILQENSFGGPIPATIGRLSLLRELSLGKNRFNGSIPASIGHLSNLEILDVHDNSLSGTITELHLLKLRSLTKLVMEGNLLALNVSSSWIAPFQLRQIDISSCIIVGGSFPNWLRTQTNISRLAMSNSSISGDIPLWFETVSSSITKLDLSYNQISNRLPRLGKSVAASSRRIFLHHNRFDGPLTHFPSDVVELDVSNNKLHGEIPWRIIKMTPGLAFFSVAGNQLNGTVSSSFCDMKDLIVLDLSNNHLHGTVPRCWNNSENLRVIDLSFNHLSGHIPPSFGSLQRLLSFHLQGNGFEGNLPSTFRNLNNLRTLDLSKNFLTGFIPSWIGENMSSLSILNVHSNMFYGEIPWQLCRLASLSILDLANNKMTGVLPSCFDKLTAMSSTGLTFDDSSNYYSSNSIMNGTQPAVYDENIMAYVKGIELKYTSTLPFLCSIDLSDNNFGGRIPKVLMTLSALRNLNLSGNNLVGHIPSILGSLKSLESLDLSRNELTGSIPESIADLNYLGYLNLSYNNLSGRIPFGKQLQTLDDKLIYAGNSGLCGFPLKSCHSELPDKQTGKRLTDESELPWFFYSAGIGFLTGYVGFCSLLYFNSTFRHLIFRFIENMYNKLYVTILTKREWLKTRFHQQRT